MRVQVGRQLLDRQIVDVDGLPVGKVDDVEFAVDEEGYPYVAYLLSGHAALGPRVGGVAGRLLVAVADRLVADPPARPRRIPFSLVVGVGSAVRLRARGAELPESPVEGYLRRRLIARIPGAGRASG